MAQGAAFARTTGAAWGVTVPAMPYPVAVGHAARRLGLPAAATVTLYLQAFAANVISAGVRLIPIGQTDGQRIAAALMPLVARVAAAALEGAARVDRRLRRPRRPRLHAPRNPVHEALSLMKSPHGPLRVGIGGPVGAGKTALMAELCKRMRGRYSIAAITNDIYTREDAEFLMRAQALPLERIMGVETGGCPHTAIREDASINLAAVDEMVRRFPDLDLILIESAATTSRPRSRPNSPT